MDSSIFPQTFGKWGNASAATAYKVLKVGAAAETVDYTGADTDHPVAVTIPESIGVAQNDPLPALPLLPGHKYQVEAAAAISAMAEVAPSTSGEVKTAQAGDTVIGFAYTAADGDGSVFDLLACHQYTKA